jgi:hypothetical protein
MRNLTNVTVVSSVSALLVLVGCQAQHSPSPEADTASAPAAVSDAAGPEAATSARSEPPARREPPTPPTPKATPEPTPVVVPAGTLLSLELRSTHSSKTSQAGDRTLAVLLEDVRVEEQVVIPAGSELYGSVLAAVPSGRVKGKARLAIVFDKAQIDGQQRGIESAPIDVTADDSKKRDAAIIGGGAGAGAIVGGIAKGKKGAAIGAAIGGIAGTGAVLGTTGKEVEFAAGSHLKIQLSSALRLP